MNKKSKQAEEEKDINTEVEEWKNKYLRALADYHNLEKRTESQIELQIKTTKKRLFLKFLDILDNIVRAEIFIKDAGLQLVISDFHKMLTSENVTKMDLLKKPYDPHLAECVEVTTGEKDNIVIEVVQDGYMLNDEVLRVAQVKVTKKL